MFIVQDPEKKCWDLAVQCTRQENDRSIFSDTMFKKNKWSVSLYKKKKKNEREKKKKVFLSG